MTEQPCPHDEQLASFVRCELSEEVAANVLDHLDNCPHCEETVANLEHTIKSVLPGAAATMSDVPYSDESACQRAIQSLISEFATPSSDADPGTKQDSMPGEGARAEFQTLRDFRIIEKVVTAHSSPSFSAGWRPALRGWQFEYRIRPNSSHAIFACGAHVGFGCCQ